VRALALQEAPQGIEMRLPGTWHEVDGKRVLRLAERKDSICLLDAHAHLAGRAREVPALDAANVVALDNFSGNFDVVEVDPSTGIHTPLISDTTKDACGRWRSPRATTFVCSSRGSTSPTARGKYWTTSDPIAHRSPSSMRPWRSRAPRLSRTALQRHLRGPPWFRQRLRHRISANADILSQASRVEAKYRSPNDPTNHPNSTIGPVAR
jgi:hypothetical protein